MKTLNHVESSEDELTSMPIELSAQHPTKRFTYLIRPFKTYGHPILATRAGAMLQNAIIPFGVDGGTKSSAAESMITYNTVTRVSHK
jgi:hypothetical protein